MARLGRPLLRGLEPFDFPPNRNPARRYVAQMGTAESRHTVAKSLAQLAAVSSGYQITADRFPWHQLTYVETARMRTALIEHHEPQGANLRLATLRGVLRECWRLELMSAEQFQRATDLANVRGGGLPRGRALPAMEIRALFEACGADPRPAGARDTALFALMYGSALRRAELVGLDLADWRRVDQVLRVPGKGRRERLTPIVEGVEVALARWVEVRGDWKGPLFVAISRKGELGSERMASRSIYDVCLRRALRAKIRRFTPHDLRRTTVSDLLDSGEDVAAVSDLVGHAKLETTAKYDRRGDRRKRQAAGRLFIPVTGSAT